MCFLTTIWLIGVYCTRYALVPVWRIPLVRCNGTANPFQKFWAECLISSRAESRIHFESPPTVLKIIFMFYGY